MRNRLLGALLTTALTGAALTAGALPAQAEGRVVGAGAPGAVTGRYIVTLKRSGMGAADVIGRSGRTVTTTMSARQARRLAADPKVEYVEQDRIMHVEGTRTNPTWGLDRIDQRS